MAQKLTEIIYLLKAATVFVFGGLVRSEVDKTRQWENKKYMSVYFLSYLSVTFLLSM